MPRIPGTTNAQTTFLRAFRTNPAGPPPEEWPAPAVLRRWLRRPAFQDALVTLREVLRFRTEFHLTAAAAQAAQATAVACFCGLGSHDSGLPPSPRPPPPN